MHPRESSPTHTRKSPRSSNWQFTCQEGAVELCHLGHAHGVWVRDSAAGDRSIISVGHQYGQEAICSGAFAMKATRAHERAVDMRLHCPRPYSQADLCGRSMLRACSGLNTKPRCGPSTRMLLLCPPRAASSSMSLRKPGGMYFCGCACNASRRAGQESAGARSWRQIALLLAYGRMHHRRPSSPASCPRHAGGPQRTMSAQQRPLRMRAGETREAFASLSRGRL